MRVAITPRTKDQDDKLRKELEHADVDKFKRVIKQSFQSSSAKKKSKKK
jgi:hypothetical protein